MLAGLKLCLGRNAFFTGAPEARLRPLLKASREAQNEVSDKLSGQVLGALYELLRGLHRAAPERIEALAENDAHHLYEGLLTCLMRLVFLLYAEDRDLLPTSSDPKLKALWESGYSIKTLYARLLADEAVNPDTMDERRGGWGQLLAVFRLVHGSQYTDWVTPRGGKLFDPDAFAFLEGRGKSSPRTDGKVLPVSDGTILRILHGLMTVDGRSFSGEKIRERLSYRSLDVESIGSVYETVMGFTAKRASERMIALRDEKKLPAFVGLASLLKQKPNDRQKWLKEKGVKLSTKQASAVKSAADEGSLLEAFGTLIDERASPKGASIGPGTPYLQPTEERRRSGSHYTPRSLTEPIVRHALEPAFERIGANASPEEVLALKVLDPACGSGAFLVEACRQLGARLEQAWDIHKAEKPAIPPDEDEATHAKRLVAQRCLYGVDRNPMAVDLARLSLWLATLAREHEFSFLDHALKAGDSLVGLTQAEIAAANWDSAKPGLPLFRKMIKDGVDRALQGREAIRTAPDDVSRAIQESRYRRSEEQVDPARIVGDAVIAAFFSADKTKAREDARVEVEQWISDSVPPKWDLLEAKAKGFRNEHGWRPFHWEIEFPEAFVRENPGFDAIVGNPPFAGKNTISAASGSKYLPWLQQLHEGAHGNADLAAHFYRRAFSLLRNRGMFGFIASNTIKQGDTRQTGLRSIVSNGGSIVRAITRYRWQGEASVVVSFVHIYKGSSSLAFLNGRRVNRISSFLVEGTTDDAPAELQANANKAFQGSVLLGTGFIFDDKLAAEGKASSLALRVSLLGNPENRKRIFPYIGGEDVNTEPDQTPQRWCIDFFDLPLMRVGHLQSWSTMGTKEKEKVRKSGRVPSDYPDAVAADWPELLEIVKRLVEPERATNKNRERREMWWQHTRRVPALRRAIESLERIFVITQTSPHLAVSQLPTGYVYDQKLVVVASDLFSLFASVQSRVHEVWSRSLSGTLGDTLSYTPSDSFRPFPFPRGYETDAALEATGQRYHDHRAALMVAANEGMTKTYNRFHKPEEKSPAIQRLRELHDEMDRAVLRAYGWDDLAETLKPQFLTSETEDDHTYQSRYFWPAEQRDLVLSRLLTLNAERYAEEVAAGIAPSVSKRRAAAAADDANEDQDSFDLE